MRPDSTFYSQNYRITESVITESGSFRDAQTASHLLVFLLHLLEDKLCERRGEARLVLTCMEHSENIFSRIVSPLLELLNFQEAVTATFITTFYI